MARRGVIAAATGVVLLVVLTPFTGFDLSAFYTYLVFVFLYVPEWGRIPRVGKFIVPLGILLIAVLYPYYADDPTKMFTIPILGAFPDVHTGVVMLIFVMMGVGLNVVVGYAGLLDL